MIGFGQKNGYVSVAVKRFKDYDKKSDEKIYSEWYSIVNMKKNLLTNAGKDEFHKLCYINDDSVAPNRGSGCIGLSMAIITPAVTDTSLNTEITTGGLNRTDALTKTHTLGTNSSLIEHTFTATIAFTTNSGVRAVGLFNALSGGIMSHEATFTPISLAIFDQIKVSYTLNLS